MPGIVALDEAAIKSLVERLIRDKASEMRSEGSKAEVHSPWGMFYFG